MAMFSEKKFLATKETSKAKRMAELLRVIILQPATTCPAPNVNSRPMPNG